MSETTRRLPWWRQIISALLGTLVALLIVIGLPLATLAQLLTDKDSLLGIIQDQRLYETVKANALNIPIETAQKEGGEAAAQNLAGLEIYRQLFDDYLTYATYQRITSEFAEGMYQWLDGTLAQPDFKIRLADSPAAFKKLVADLLITRYNSFPLCTDQAATTDPFAAECRDPNLKTSQLRSLIETELKASDFSQAIDQASISSDDLFKNADPNFMLDFPRYFRLANLLPWLLLSTILLLSALMYLTIWHAKSALKKIGWTWLIPSALMLLAAISWWQLDSQVIKRLQSGSMTAENTALIEVGEQLAKRLFDRIGTTWLWLSLVLVLIASAMLVGSHFLDRANANSSATPLPAPTARKPA
ncbi:hypothetical protein HY346_00785 [Candidatus Microgenomates bacterium]|nr:hypothetical protein [Candidatus Microgenomates bacterium]